MSHPTMKDTKTDTMAMTTDHTTMATTTITMMFMTATTTDTIAMTTKATIMMDMTITETAEMDGIKNTTIMSWNCNSSQIPSWPNFRP